MDKTKIKLQSLIILFFVYLNTSLYSQESFTKELKWKFQDSISEVILKDTNQIIERSIFPHATYKSKNIIVENNDVYILIIDVCSGIYCYYISIYKKEGNFWRLIANTTANLKEQIGIVEDNNQKKIIFKTKSGKIGELQFKIFDLSTELVE